MLSWAVEMVAAAECCENLVGGSWSIDLGLKPRLYRSLTWRNSRQVRIPGLNTRTQRGPTVWAREIEVRVSGLCNLDVRTSKLTLAGSCYIAVLQKASIWSISLWSISKCFSRQLFSFYFSFPPLLKSSTPSADTCFTDFFPETISLSIAKIDDQSSKIVNGTFSLTQYDTRSVIKSALFSCYFIEDLPCPFFANKRSVSFAAERSETPSPA